MIEYMKCEYKLVINTDLSRLVSNFIKVTHIIQTGHLKINLITIIIVLKISCG